MDPITPILIADATSFEITSAQMARSQRSATFPTWKRVFDVTIALAALVFLLPLMFIAALIIALDGGQVIFCHDRVGADGKLFRIFKFRTMCSNADERLKNHLESNETARGDWQIAHKLRNDPRITPIGSFLRKSSIDELPQLFNVLRGEMSIVGPRPIVQSEIAKYGRYIHHYQRCRPGITGLWQVSGRSNVSYRRRVALDTVYCRKMGNPRFELAILLKTIPAVLSSKGSY